MGQDRTRSLFASVLVLSLLPRCFEHKTHTHTIPLTHTHTHTHTIPSRSSFYLISTPLAAHHIHTTVSLIIFSGVQYIALLSLFISLSPYQHSYLLVCHLLSVSSISSSFHSLPLFLPHFLSSRRCFRSSRSVYIYTMYIYIYIYLHTYIYV